GNVPCGSNWISTFHAGCLNFCLHLGANCLGSFLGLGSQRSLGTCNMVFLCSILTPTALPGLAWGKIFVVGCWRICHHHVQSYRCKSSYRWFTFLCITFLGSGQLLNTLFINRLFVSKIKICKNCLINDIIESIISLFINR